jgi:hypothetical protein
MLRPAAVCRARWSRNATVGRDPDTTRGVAAPVGKLPFAAQRTAAGSTAFSRHRAGVLAGRLPRALQVGGPRSMGRWRARRADHLHIARVGARSCPGRSRLARSAFRADGRADNRHRPTNCAVTARAGRGVTGTGECYLGDGLYASFDGWQIVLRGPREQGGHREGLEPEVMAALVTFLADLNRQSLVFRCLRPCGMPCGAQRVPSRRPSRTDALAGGNAQSPHRNAVPLCSRNRSTRRV